MSFLDRQYYFEDLSAFPWPHLLPQLDALPAYWTAKKKVLAELRRQIRCPLPTGVVIEGEVEIGEGTVIDPFVYIEGPVSIGRNVTIRSGAWIRPGCLIGDEVVVGHGMELKNVHLARGVKMGTNTFVGDSILGEGARIGSGTIIGNRRFDQKEIVLKIEGQEYATGTDKLGVIMGDYTRLGSNVSTSPGTVVGRQSWVYANAVLSGFIPAQKLVKIRQTQEIVDKTDLLLSAVDMSGHV